MEHVKRFHLLARTHKLDGLRHHRADGEGCTATCVTIELGQNHAVNLQTLVEGLGGVDSILSGHSIDHKQGLVRIDSGLDLLNLLHQLLVNRLTASGIDNHHVVALGLGLLNGMLSHSNRVGCTFLQIARHTYLLGQHAQLLHSRRTEGVTGSEQGLLVVLGLQAQS